METFRAGLVLDGRYRLERPLAEGGMGSIWVGNQIALQREVAVKLLRVSGAALRARLRREALALAAVHHPSVVQVHDYGELADGTPYLVMELVRGEALGQRIVRAGPLAATDAALLMLPLLEGLAAAHRAGVVHRDIKPDNVVLAVSPGGAQPKLLDFGIARFDRDAAAKLTGEGGFIGTPAYMAPEQVRGGDVDERADVWSMGALLYEAIAGRAPFGIDDVIAVIRRVLDDPPPYPRAARGLDGRLWGVLMGALRKDPAERTPTALAFRDALAGWLESQGTTPSFRPIPAGLTPLPGRPISVRLPDTLDAPASPRLPDTLDAPISSVDPGADTAPVTPIEAPPSLDALIRAKLGQS
jgi:serine/threonine-protein kinase